MDEPDKMCPLPSDPAERRKAQTVNDRSEPQSLGHSKHNFGRPGYCLMHKVLGCVLCREKEK